MPRLDRRVCFALEGEERTVWAERTDLNVTAEGASAQFRVRFFRRSDGSRVRPKDVGKLTDDYGQLWQVAAVAEAVRRRFLVFDCEALTR